LTIIRQISFFGIQELYEMEPTHRYDAIFSDINLEKICHAISKKSNLGASEKLNYAAMVISVFIQIVERIPTILCETA